MCTKLANDHTAVDRMGLPRFIHGPYVLLWHEADREQEWLQYTAAEVSYKVKPLQNNGASRNLSGHRINQVVLRCQISWVKLLFLFLIKYENRELENIHYFKSNSFYQVQSPFSQLPSSLSQAIFYCQYPPPSKKNYLLGIKDQFSKGCFIPLQKKYLCFSLR